MMIVAIRMMTMVAMHMIVMAVMLVRAGAGPVAGAALEEPAAGRLEHVGEQRETSRGRRGVAEGVAAHGGDGRPGG